MSDQVSSDVSAIEASEATTASKLSDIATQLGTIQTTIANLQAQPSVSAGDLSSLADLVNQAQANATSATTADTTAAGIANPAPATPPS